MRSRRKYGGQKQKMNKMNCHPAVIGKTAGPDTCYTEPIAKEIVAGFNRTSSRKARNLHDVKQMVKCKKEDCLLRFLSEEIRSKVDKTHFAPDMPKEWIKDPDAWLSNLDIVAVVKQYESVYPEFCALEPTTIDFDKSEGGQCVSDELCHFSLEKQMAKGKRKFGLVINLDVSTGGGTHWVSLYFDMDNRYMFYFDSAGESYIPKEIAVFMDRVKQQAQRLTPLGKEKGIDLKVHHNCKIRHQSSGSECGMYALFFIITQLTGKVPYEKRVYGINERIQLFLKKRIPDNMVFKFRKLYFNVPDTGNKIGGRNTRKRYGGITSTTVTTTLGEGGPYTDSHTTHNSMLSAFKGYLSDVDGGMADILNNNNSKTAQKFETTILYGRK